MKKGKENFDPNHENSEGQSYLHLYASWGELTATNVFTAAGADVNKQDKYGMTPMHHAAYNGHTQVVRALFNAGANPHIRMVDGRTACDLARSEKYELLVKYMERHILGK